MEQEDFDELFYNYGFVNVSEPFWETYSKTIGDSEWNTTICINKHKSSNNGYSLILLQNGDEILINTDCKIQDVLRLMLMIR